MPIKHLKVSLKTDAADSSLVRASDWNAVHDLSGFVANDVSDFAEAVDDRVNALLKQGANVTLTYDDTANTLTVASTANGNLTTVSDTAPATPAYGDRWIKPSNMTEMVWVPNTGTPGVWINPSDAAVASRSIIPTDGTVAAPGLAWASEPGFGWYRGAASFVGLGAQGALAFSVDAGTAATTYLRAYPRGAGDSMLALFNQAQGAANYNYMTVMQKADGTAQLGTAAIGTATAGNLALNAPQVLFNDGTAAKPTVSFASEPGLGFYRVGANNIAVTAGGVLVSYLYGSAAGTSFSLQPRVSGQPSTIYMANKPGSDPNYNLLVLEQLGGGHAGVRTAVIGGATRGNLILDAPVVSMPVGTVSIASPANPSILLTKGASGNSASIISYTGNNTRWLITMGSGTAESGANAGSDFIISRCGDNGAWTGDPFTINRATGNVSAQGLTTTLETAALVDQITELRDRVTELLARVATLEAGS